MSDMRSKEKGWVEGGRGKPLKVGEEEEEEVKERDLNSDSCLK